MRTPVVGCPVVHTYTAMQWLLVLWSVGVRAAMADVHIQCD